jgi:pimeloyl-ACP methyl ester carboxylesterase
MSHEKNKHSRNGISRRELGAIAAGAIATGPVALQAQAPVGRSATASPANPGPVLDVAEWSYFWVGVEKILTARGTLCNGMQMYVEYWIPNQVRHPYPVVLVHGGQGQGTDWLSTPDGRRGWISHLIEQGYKVYAVDRPGQGRPPYFPWFHGYFDEQAPTFESVSRNLTARGAQHTQWPGSGAPDDPSLDQVLGAQGQALAVNPFTLNIWRTRGSMLLDQIGAAIFMTHGDGSIFAWMTAQEKPDLVKGIVAVEQSANSLQALGPQVQMQERLKKLNGIPIAVVTAEASPASGADAGIVSALKQAGNTVEHIKLADRGIRGNGPLIMMEKNNREALQPILDWMDANITKGAPAAVMPGRDPNRNSESTALKLADQGCFWVGVHHKQMPYGTIAEGQTYVQYMIPAERRYTLPIVMVHGGGGQGMHMMGIGRRPGWVHYFVQAGYAVYWIDRPGFGRSPYHPDALGPSHLRNVPPYEGLVASTAVFNTAQWPGTGGMNDPLVDQFMACEVGNVADEAYHSELNIRGGVELLDRLGPCILFTHAFGGFWGWLMADRRPNLVKAIMAMEINGNPFAAQFKWGLTAAPMTYDPPVTDPSQFRLVDAQLPPDSPRPLVPSFKLQAEPARQWKNLKGIPIGWMTSEFGGGGSANAQVAFLKQVGCSVELVRLRDYGIHGNGNLMLMEKNNHEVFAVMRDWLDRKVSGLKA